MLKKQAEQTLFFFICLSFLSPRQYFPLLFKFSSLDSVIFGLIGRKKRFGLAAISEGWEKVFHRSREVYACINPMLFMFSIMEFFVHVTDKLQRAHVINYNQGLIL